MTISVYNGVGTYLPIFEGQEIRYLSRNSTHPKILNQVCTMPVSLKFWISRKTVNLLGLSCPKLHPDRLLAK